MVEAKPWNWDKVDEAYWLEPALDVRLLLDRWRREGRSRLLDLGCGLGRHSLLFARSGFSVTGYDLSPVGLERLRELSAAEGLRVATELGELRDLPFHEGAFDCVLAYRSIYHCDFAALVDSVGEALRVLAPGGELYANFLSKESAYYRSGEGSAPAPVSAADPRVRMKLEEGGALLPHCYLDEAQLRELLSGFEIVRLAPDAEPESPGASRYFTVIAARAPAP